MIFHSRQGYGPRLSSAHECGFQMLAYIDYLIFRFQYFLKHRRGRPEHELAIRRLYGDASA